MRLPPTPSAWRKLQPHHGRTGLDHQSPESRAGCAPHQATEWPRRNAFGEADLLPSSYIRLFPALLFLSTALESPGQTSIPMRALRGIAEEPSPRPPTLLRFFRTLAAYAKWRSALRCKPSSRPPGGGFRQASSFAGAGGHQEIGLV